MRVVIVILANTLHAMTTVSGNDAMTRISLLNGFSSK